MADVQLDIVLHHVRKLVTPSQPCQPMDGQLLERFALGREEAAFATLVQRYGPLVLGVCRRVLCHEHDAEDAFQATFLVLARSAAAIRKQESVGSWLYGVAHRVALKAKAEATRRHIHHRIQPANALAEPLADLTWKELCAALDEELTRLPDKYRAPLLLYYMEGHTQDEAAARLGWARGTLKRRLERGRDILRGRLLRRGLTLSAGLFAAALAGTQAAVPAALASAAVQAASAWTAAGTTASAVAALAESATPAACATKLKLAVGLMLLIAAAGVGGGMVAYQESTDTQAEVRFDEPSNDSGPVPTKSPPARGKTADPQRKAEVAEQAKPKEDRPEDPVSDDADLPARRVLRLGKAVIAMDGKLPAYAVAPDGSIAANMAESVITIYPGPEGKSVQKIRLPPGEVMAMAFSLDSKKLAADIADQKLLVFDTGTGKVVKETNLETTKIIKGVKTDYSGQIRARAFSADGELLAFADPDDPVIHIVAVSSGKKWALIKDAKAPARSLAFAPDSKSIAAVVQQPGKDSEQHVMAWDVQTTKKRFEVETLQVSSLAFSKDGMLAGGVPEGGVRLWNIAKSREVGYLFRSKAAEDRPAITKLIERLGGDDYKDRVLATQKLQGLGVGIEPWLLKQLRPARTRRPLVDAGKSSRVSGSPCPRMSMAGA
jgi:RNA polymerase sigma factor (sigma-70 family)